MIESYPKLYSGGHSDGVGLGRKEQFAANWGEYEAIITLANDDFTRIDEVTKLPLHRCLMYIEYKSERAKFDQEMMKL